MRTLFLVLLLTATLSAASKPISMRVSPARSIGPVDIILTITIERVPENRQLSWACVMVGDTGFETSEDFTLDGENSPPQFVIDKALRRMWPGEYVCQADLVRTNGRYSATAKFVVQGDDGHE